MAQAIINFKTDAKLKAETKKVLDAMGLNFSIAFNAYMRTIITEKRIEFTTPEIPNARLRKAMRETEKEHKEGTLSGPFATHEDFERSLLS